MSRTIIIIILFVIGMGYELQQIITFEKKQKQDKDEEFIQLFRKCHWTYFLIFVAGAADRIIALIEKLKQRQSRRHDSAVSPISSDLVIYCSKFERINK